MSFFGQPVEYPIKVYCDNVGAIYHACNEKISRKTKHVDTRTHFVRHYVKQIALNIQNLCNYMISILIFNPRGCSEISLFFWNFIGCRKFHVRFSELTHVRIHSIFSYLIFNNLIFILNMIYFEIS